MTIRVNVLAGLLAAVMTAGVISAAAAQPAATPAPAPTPTPTPTGPQRFAAQIEAFGVADAAGTPMAPCPVVLVGSSSARFWRTVSWDLAPLPVINRGFGGSQIPDVNYYFDQTVGRYHPRAILFYAGDNDINAGRTPAQVVADFERFLALKDARLPSGTPVYFIAVKPSKRRWSQMAAQTEVNEAIKALAARRGDLIYIDVVAPMLLNGAPREIFVADGLHMTPAGYEIWTSAAKPVLTAGPMRATCP